MNSDIWRQYGAKDWHSGGGYSCPKTQGNMHFMNINQQICSLMAIRTCTQVEAAADI